MDSKQEIPEDQSRSKRISTARQAIRNRIVAHSEEDPGKLIANPLNFRRHPDTQRAALRGSMKELGWIKSVLVNRTTGNVIDGHARCEEAKACGATVPVDWVEMTPEEERLALAVLDPITEMATRDDEALGVGRGHYHWQHEPCWYAVRKGGTGHWAGDRKQSTLWAIPNMHRTQGNVDDGKTAHSTQKPVECMRRPIVNNSSPGQAVYEPFAGSGTTLIACETEQRSCYAMELDPTYCDIIVKRWENATGKKAVLES